MKSIQLVGYSDPIPIDTIVWLQGDANYTRVYYQTGTSVLVTQSLHWFEQNLDFSFVRIHRSTMINPNYVKEFGQTPGRSGWVRLVDDRVLLVSRNRLQSTVSRLKLTSNPVKLSNE